MHMNDPGGPRPVLRRKLQDEYLVRVLIGPWGIFGVRFMSMSTFRKAVRRGDRWAVRASRKMDV